MQVFLKYKYNVKTCMYTISALKIVLLGTTGHGKSSCGNTILSEQIFKTESSPESVTAECKSGVAMVGGRTVTVIDTPGIFDTRLEEEVIKSQIIKSIIECAPAVDALVIVLKVGRYTRQERETLDKIVEYCGEEAFKHAVVLFTYGEELDGQTIEEFVQKSTKLQELVDKCGGHCHVIDNKHWNDCHLGYRSNKVQVKNLLDTIDKMVEENGCYTNDLMLNVEEEIQDTMNSMLIVNLSTEEKREVAKKIVLKKYLIRFAGAATGTLIGAFLGIGVAVASVVALLKAAKLKEVVKAIGIAVTAAGTVADKTAVAAAAGGTAAVGTAAVSAVAGAVEAGVAAGAVGATAAAGVAAVEAGVAAGTTGAAVGATAAAAGTVAVETGVAAGAGIGAAAGSGIAAGVVFGAAALAGAIGGGIAGYKAAKDADSVLDAIKISAKVNYENAKEVVKKAERLPSNVYKKLQ
uniref:GTPase IMAP family member 7-like n=1 Tax=Sinocyclocheilus anshuiensis TaxID=1608454 RepID=A0A671LY95_9TELE